MASLLQELRKTAGYKNARDFAEALDIPTNTYARYESNPEKIPLDRAWLMADKLNCSIDMVVGRKESDEVDLRGEIQKIHDTFIPEMKELHFELTQFVAQKNNAIIKERKFEERAKYRRYAEHYLDLFTREIDRDDKIAQVVIFGTEEQKRDAFREFVDAIAERKRELELKAEQERLEFILAEAGEITTISPDSNQVIHHYCDEPEFYAEADKMLLESIEEKREGLEKRDEETILKIMDAYDELGDRGKSRITYGYVSF